MPCILNITLRPSLSVNVQRNGRTLANSVARGSSNLNVNSECVNCKLFRDSAGVFGLHCVCGNGINTSRNINGSTSLTVAPFVVISTVSIGSERGLCTFANNIVTCDGELGRNCYSIHIHSLAECSDATICTNSLCHEKVAASFSDRICNVS